MMMLTDNSQSARIKTIVKPFTSKRSLARNKVDSAPIFREYGIHTFTNYVQNSLATLRSLVNLQACLDFLKNFFELLSIFEVYNFPTLQINPIRDYMNASPRTIGRVV
jgi:hypothetical protein